MTSALCTSTFLLNWSASLPQIGVDAVIVSSVATTTQVYPDWLPCRSVTIRGRALETTVLESIATNMASRRPLSASRISRCVIGWVDSVMVVFCNYLVVSCNLCERSHHPAERSLCPRERSPCPRERSPCPRERSVRNQYGVPKRPFAGTKRPFGGTKRPFGATKRPFVGERSDPQALSR